MDTIAILSKDTMRYNITKGNSGQFHKAWVSCPLRKNVDGALLSPSVHKFGYEHIYSGLSAE
jgi:hypothetical protein